MVCEMIPKKVFSKLLKYDVPLDSCLNLVCQYNILDAEAYLEYRLGRTTKAVDLYRKVLASLTQLITRRFESSMRGETFSEKDMVEAYFSYIMAVKICEEVIRDYPDEGIPLIVSLLESCISVFSDLIVNNKESSLDTQVKAVELKNFIFQNLIPVTLGNIVGGLVFMVSAAAAACRLLKLQLCSGTSGVL